MNILIIKKINIIKILFAMFIIAVGLIGCKGYITDVFNEIKDMGKYKPISNVSNTDNNIVLTFEVHDNTPELSKTLGILKETNTIASFFVVGAWAQKNPAAVKLIYNNGHEIGNHSHTHCHTTTMTSNEFRQEVKACNKVIKDTIGVNMKTYKFPYSDYKNEHVSMLYDESLFPISANIISNDYKELGKEDLIKNVLNNKELKSGSIIEFTVGAKYLNECLPEIIAGLIEKGYKLTTLDNLLYKENFTISTDGTQTLN